MDTCPIELITRIVEYACSSDFGQTACNIGLVSRFLRSVAEPIELRTILVSGLKQLQGANSRLQLVNTSPRITPSARPNYVRHLFICELTKEDAIVADTDFYPSHYDRKRGNYWDTSDGSLTVAAYHESEREFWELATLFVRSMSASLRTLFLSTSENWCMLSRPSAGHVHAKVLDTLSSTAFPKLTSLTLMHDAHSEDVAAPTIPRLQRLHITSSMLFTRTVDQNEVPLRNYPLVSLLRGEDSELTQLVIYDVGTSKRVLEVVFGENWRTSLSCGTLPGKLKSVILKHGYAPYPGYCSGYLRHIYRTGAGRRVVDVIELNVSGLEAELPDFIFPEAGEREYERLLDDWKEQCLSNP